MAHSVLIERIRSSVSSGELKPVPSQASFLPISRISDLMRSWEEVFPGADRSCDEPGNAVFGYRGLRKPKLTPRPRRSFRPLPPPRPIPASPKAVNPGLFDSIRGIWDFYTTRQIADPALLELAFTNTGVMSYVQPLFDAIQNWYPLYVPLEMMLEDCNLMELTNIHLMLPHYSYEDEEAGVVEAFLTDLESVAGLMGHYLGDGVEIELPDKDRQLIGTVGFLGLVTTYEMYRGAKSCDLSKLLQNDPDLFFAPLKERFPRQLEFGWPIISGDWGNDCDVPITSSQDIEFCIAYASAYDRVMALMPNPYEFHNNDGGITEEFMHELCEVWRKQNGKRSVKWQSPKRARLANIFKQERIRV